MIPQDKNFKKDFSAVLKDLDGVLEKHKDKVILNHIDNYKNYDSKMLLSYWL